MVYIPWLQSLMRVSIGCGKFMQTAKCKKLGQYINIVRFLIKCSCVTLNPSYTAGKKITSNL